MRIIGISPLNKNSAVCFVEDGCVVAALAEEWFSRQKMHAGFPALALAELLRRYQLTPEAIDVVASAGLNIATEVQLLKKGQSGYAEKSGYHAAADVFAAFRKLPRRNKRLFRPVPGLTAEMGLNVPWLRKMGYALASKVNVWGHALQRRSLTAWVHAAIAAHEQAEAELLRGLEQFGLKDKLVRVDRQLAQAANAYYLSGFADALIVTLDGSDSGLTGSVASGQNGKITRLHTLAAPVSLSAFAEQVTSALGFRPGHAENVIAALAAYGDPDVLYPPLRSLFEVRDGGIFHKLPRQDVWVKYLAARYPQPLVAAAFQKVLEQVVSAYLRFYQQQTGLTNIVFAGDVAANVKLNQRVSELPGVVNIFVPPATGNDGSGVGAALFVAAEKMGLRPYRLNDVYWGVDYADEEVREALAQEGLRPEKPADLAKTIAELLAAGKLVARFAGRMAYGPHGLGNRAMLYQATDAEGGRWLKRHLKRPEFLPFAAAILYEERERCCQHIAGAESTAGFMTMTFAGTDFMKTHCPAAVHVDGTVCPQLVRQELNPDFYRILAEYAQLTGIPAMLNASLNLPGEPIACTPFDAIRVFKLGQLHYLAIGPYLVKGRET